MKIQEFLELRCQNTSTYFHTVTGIQEWWWWPMCSKRNVHVHQLMWTWISITFLLLTTLSWKLCSY